jgi:hypothetical protein
MQKRYLYIPINQLHRGSKTTYTEDVPIYTNQSITQKRYLYISYPEYYFFFFRMRVLDLRLLECYFVSNTNGESIFDNYNNKIINFNFLPSRYTEDVPIYTNQSITQKRYLYISYPERSLYLVIHEISQHFCRQMDSDLAVIGLTGIGPIRKISVLDWFLRVGPMKVFSFCFDRFDHIKANKSKLINNTSSDTEEVRQGIQKRYLYIPISQLHRGGKNMYTEEVSISSSVYIVLLPLCNILIGIYLGTSSVYTVLLPLCN